MLRRTSLFIALVVTASACSSTSEVFDTSTPAPAETTTTTAPTTAAPTTTTTTTPATTATTAQTATTLVQPGGCESVKGGTYTVTVGQNQTMDVFVPSGFSGEPLPVVVNFHALGSDGFQEAALTSYIVIAELEGFIVAHPTGRPSPGDDRNSWELAQFDIPDRDDVALAGEIIDTLIQDFCGDPLRVYLTGMSNGGLFTSYLVCELSERIAAAVSVAGVTHHDECEPARPVPMMAFHGTADKIVPFAGGTSSLPGGDSDFFKQVMPVEFAEFAADFNCDTSPTETDVSASVIRYDYSGCDAAVPLVFFEITDGGHTWPGSLLGPLLTQIMGPTNYDVDATLDGWEFMSQFSLAS